MTATSMLILYWAMTLSGVALLGAAGLRMARKHPSFRLVGLGLAIFLYGASGLAGDDALLATLGTVTIVLLAISELASHRRSPRQSS